MTASVPSFAMGDIGFLLLIFFVILARVQDDSHGQWDPAILRDLDGAGAPLANVAIDSARWPTMFLISIAPAAALWLGMRLSPESPRWLASQHRAQEARSAGRRLWGQGPASEAQMASLLAEDGKGAPGPRGHLVKCDAPCSPEALA